MAIESSTQPTHVAHIIIASLALTGNSLVCLLFWKNRVLLKKSYNVFLLILAITDLVTAVVLLVSSALILSGLLPNRDNILANKIFCHGIWSGWILFMLSDASIYICLVLTYKRWCAVVKPLSFTTNFNKRRLIGTSVAICLIAVFSTLPRYFEVYYDVSHPENLCCSWKALSAPKRQYMAVIQLAMNIIFPSGVMIGIYCHMLYRTRIHKNRVLPSDRALRTRQARTRMVRIALFVMLTCWMPYQILYLLSLFGVTQLDSTPYHWTTALVFVTSCLNPFIYGVTNHTYRRGYFEIALGCCPVKVHGFLSRHLSQTHHAAVLVHSIHGRRPLSAPQTLRQTVMLELNP